MTIAVCLSCGAMKGGAWTTCPECRHHPVTLDDRAAHFICSDKCNTVADLEGIARRIRDGETLQFSEEDLAFIKERLAEMAKRHMGG